MFTISFRLTANKLSLENWQNCNFHPSKTEISDYVLVGEKIWNMLKKTYGGGPAIQFFLTNNEKVIADEGLDKQSNFLYQNDYLMYGYPDKHPQYYNISLEMMEMANGTPNTIKIPYRLLLSHHMPIKSLLYYVATKLRVDISLLTVAINSENQEVAELNAENGVMTLNEANYFYSNPHYAIRYSGSTGKPIIHKILDDIGEFENENVYAFFGIAQPILASTDGK